MSWPPTAAEFYLELGGRDRPPFQGDVYDRVPFVKVKRGSKLDDEPSLQVERRPVAAFSHPCDMVVADDGYTLRKAQTVVLVRKESGDGLPPSWEGCHHLCPLPDLYGDGEMWVADFTVMTHVDRFYLAPERRVRCLSELGWTVFRQRAALESSRNLIDLEDLRQVGAATWTESMMEMDWLAAGRSQASFQAWLNSADEKQCSGFEKRREVLDEDGGIDKIGALLHEELAAGAPSPAEAHPPGRVR